MGGGGFLAFKNRQVSSASRNLGLVISSIYCSYEIGFTSIKLSTIPGPSAIYQLEAFVRMGAKDILVNLLGAMCLIALSPSLSCLPSVPTVSRSGEAFGAKGFFAEVAFRGYTCPFAVPQGTGGLHNCKS